MAKAKLKALSDSEILKGLGELHGWRFSRGALRCEFQFESFKKALQFVNTVGAMAESANHHPDIDIRWRTVTFTLVTHSAGGITDKDVALAGQINDTLARLHRAMFLEASPAPAKYALSLLGLCTDEVRLPLVSVQSAEVKKEIEAAMKEAGVL